MARRFALAVLVGAAALQARPAPAQPRSGLLVSGGLGLTVADVDGANGSGSGGYAAVEYVQVLEEWFTPRAYLGVILTWPEPDCGPGVSPCDVSSRIFVAGIKARVMAPIPWVGPFGEVGVGLSVGSLTTLNGAVVQAEAQGVIPHVQFAVGLALGPRHQVALSFQYLTHDRGRQTTGGVVAGFEFPLE